MRGQGQDLRTPPTPQGRLRKQAGLSLRALEELTDINRGELSMWERGLLLLEPEQVARIMAVLDAKATA